jgi:hypothetical protein
MLANLSVEQFLEINWDTFKGEMGDKGDVETLLKMVECLKDALSDESRRRETSDMRRESLESAHEALEGRLSALEDALAQ